jgi:hypothetical protein
MAYIESEYYLMIILGCVVPGVASIVIYYLSYFSLRSTAKTSAGLGYSQVFRLRRREIEGLKHMPKFKVHQDMEEETTDNMNSDYKLQKN